MDRDFYLVRRDEELVLSLGTNMGNRAQNLDNAISRLSAEIGEVVRASEVHETKPWGKTDQSEFLNQIIVLKTNMRPMIIMEEILKIERDLGRVRFEKWGPRLIDIDILFYGNQVFQSDLLEIPHPYLHQRRFVLEPLMEVMPDFVHPLLNKSISELLEELKKTEK